MSLIEGLIIVARPSLASGQLFSLHNCAKFVMIRVLICQIVITTMINWWLVLLIHDISVCGSNSLIQINSCVTSSLKFFTHWLHISVSSSCSDHGCATWVSLLHLCLNIKFLSVEQVSIIWRCVSALLLSTSNNSSRESIFICIYDICDHFWRWLLDIGIQIASMSVSFFSASAVKWLSHYRIPLLHLLMITAAYHEVKGTAIVWVCRTTWCGVLWIVLKLCLFNKIW